MAPERTGHPQNWRQLVGDRGSLMLFVDTPEVAVAAPRAPGVRYFEGGRIHEAGEIQLADDETLYLAPGAVVHGTVRAKNASGVRISGPGILDARPRTTRTQLVVLEGCQVVELRDVLVLGAYGWALVPYLCTDVRLTNVKVLGWRGNDDGLDICSSRRVTVDRCFFRTKDDCIAIKAPLGDGSSQFDVADILVHDSVFWNAQWGNAMEIGFELRTLS
jgi:polygalacturonase